MTLQKVGAVTIDWQAILTQMLVASASVVQSTWGAMAPYVEHEFAGYLQDVQFINNLLSRGSITKEEASVLLLMHQDSMKAVLLTATGVNILMVEQIINTALGILLKAANTLVSGLLVV